MQPPNTNNDNKSKGSITNNDEVPVSQQQNPNSSIKLQKYNNHSYRSTLIPSLIISLISLTIVYFLFKYLLYEPQEISNNKTSSVSVTVKPTPTIESITPTPSPTVEKQFTNNYTGRYDAQRTGSCNCTTDTPEGNLKWKLRVGEWGASSPPVVANDLLYFVGFDSHLYEVNYKTGDILWKIELDKFSRYEPEIYGENIFIGDDEGTVYSINLKGKAINWKYKTKYLRENSTYTGPVSIRSPVIYYNNMLYFSDNTAVMHCIDADTSDEIWQYKTPGSFRFSPPAFDGDVMYFGSNEGFILALDVNTGTSLWRRQLNNVITTNPILYKDFIIVNPGNGTVFALDKNLKDVVWTYSYNQEEGLSYAAPQSGSVYNNTLFLGGSSDSVLDVIDINTGKKLWQFTAESWIEASPSYSSEMLYFGTYDRPNDHHGYLYALNTTTQKEVWKFRTDEYGFQTAPFLYKDMVFAKDGHGTIFAID